MIADYQDFKYKKAGFLTKIDYLGTQINTD